MIIPLVKAWVPLRAPDLSLTARTPDGINPVGFFIRGYSVIGYPNNSSKYPNMKNYFLFLNIEFI